MKHLSNSFLSKRFSFYFYQSQGNPPTSAWEKCFLSIWQGQLHLFTFLDLLLFVLVCFYLCSFLLHEEIWCLEEFPISSCFFFFRDYFKIFYTSLVFILNYWGYLKFHNQKINYKYTLKKPINAVIFTLWWGTMEIITLALQYPVIWESCLHQS